MKVCTDSCVLGAWVDTGAARTILDIGTGTGLLALMLAQKSGALIDAVEVESSAAKQAAENFHNSPWSERLTLVSTSIQMYSMEANRRYDLMVCNPPFFENSLKTGKEATDQARHASRLSMQELWAAVHLLLEEEGVFWLLLPEQEMINTEAYAYREHGFQKKYQLGVRDQAKGKIIRKVVCFKRGLQECVNEALTIRESDGSYSEAFVEKLSPYYLNL